MNQKDGGMWTDPFWETVFRWATWTAAGAGGLSIAAAFVSAWVGYEITGATQREADQKIAGAQAQAATATERAAALENDAAQARLELERLKSIVNWRVLDPAKLTRLATALGRSKGSVTLRYVATDAESVAMAVQLSRAFEAANAATGRIIWELGPDAHVYANRLVFLTHVPDLLTSR